MFPLSPSSASRGQGRLRPRRLPYPGLMGLAVLDSSIPGSVCHLQIVLFQRGLIDSKSKELLCRGSHLRVKMGPLPGVADVRGQNILALWAQRGSCQCSKRRPEGTSQGLPANASVSRSADANLAGTRPEAGRRAWLCQPGVCPFSPPSTCSVRLRGYIKIAIQLF